MGVMGEEEGRERSGMVGRSGPGWPLGGWSSTWCQEAELVSWLILHGQGLVGDSCEGRESTGGGKMVVQKQQRGPTCLPLKPEPLLPQRLQGKRNPLGGSVQLQVKVES